MLFKFDEVSKMIEAGKLLHIAGTESLLRKLPKGKWIGGSTEDFMSEDGGKVSNELLFITEFPYEKFSVKPYGTDNIDRVVADAFEYGFSILVMPFDSPVQKEYAKKAESFEGMFMKNLAGWVSGVNLNVPGQTPVAVDGMTGTVYSDKAVALHLEVPEGKTVSINMINIFEQDEKSPLIEFTEEGFSAKKCLIDGKEMNFAQYLSENGIDTKLPLVGDYSGNGINISIKSVLVKQHETVLLNLKDASSRKNEESVVNFYAPVFSGIKYRMAKKVSDYDKEFNSRLAGLNGKNVVFSCNCILNFLYGGLEGKSIGAFVGPITFGEIVYQLVNQTLVYVSVE